jgi:hypothetical protein
MLGAMPRAALLLVAVAAATALLACKRPGAAPRPHLVQIDVRDRTADADRPARLDLAAVRDEIARLQREAGVFTVALGPAPPPPRAETFRQRVDVEVEEDVRDGQGVARAALRVVIERVDAPPGATRLEAVGGGEKPYPLEAPDPGAVFTGLVKRVVGDVMRGLLQRERLRQADPGAIVAALRSDDPETRLAAVNAAAERRERTAVPALIERLNDADDTIRDRALGALVEIGDRRAVAPLTKQTKFRDLDGMRKVVDAVASLGGDEARSYLEFVATGHEELEIRELAREALDRLTRKESRARAPRQ